MDNPKGRGGSGEDLLTRAQIEFEEEVGFRPKTVRGWIELGSIMQKGGKTVHAWAFEGDLPESFEPKSNLFEMEWPPHSGKRKQFPEVDRAVILLRRNRQTKIEVHANSFSSIVSRASRRATGRGSIAIRRSVVPVHD